MRKRKLYLLTFTIITALLASCSLAYNDKGDIKARATADKTEFASGLSRAVEPGKFTPPSYYILTVTNTEGTTIQEKDLESQSTVVSFTGLPMGNYILTAKGYSSKDSDVVIAYGSESVTVVANTENSAEVVVKPTADAEIAENGSGTIKVPLSWDETMEVTDIYLVDASNTVLASMHIDDPSIHTLDFEASIPIGLDQQLRFTLYNNGNYIAETESSGFNIYSGQISIPDEEDQKKYSDIKSDLVNNITGFSILPLTALGEVSFCFDVPKPDTFSEIRLAYTTGTTTINYLTLTPEDFGDALPGSQVTYTIKNLLDNTDYAISARMISTGEIQPAKNVREVRTAAPLNSLTITSEKEGELSFGSTRKLSISYNPAYATDFGGIWTSSNPGVVEVSSEGIISGKSTGTATIAYKANNNNIVGTYSVTVTLAKPELTYEVTNSGVNLSWSSVPYAVSYELYRNNEIIATITGDDIIPEGTMSYSDENLKTGNTYSYKVVAISTNPEGVTYSVTSSPVDAVVVKTPDISIVIGEGPASLPVVMSGLKENNSIFTWDESFTMTADISGASRYEWYLNGEKIKDGNTVEINSSLPSIDTESEHAKQSIMLIVYDDKDYPYSGSMYFYYADAKDKGIAFNEFESKRGL